MLLEILILRPARLTDQLASGSINLQAYCMCDATPQNTIKGEKVMERETERKVQSIPEETAQPYVCCHL